MTHGKISLNGGFTAPNFIELEGFLRRAGQIGMKMQQSVVATSKDNPFDLLTDADIAIQNFLTEALGNNFGAVSLVAEEQADPRILANEFFVLDPIDGTSIYASGGEDWGIQFAYFKEGRPEAGIIYLPRREIMITTIRGLGVRCNGVALEPFTPRPLGQSIVGAELGFFIPDEKVGLLLEIRKHCLGVRNLFSASANGVDLVRGLLGAYISLGGGKIWDFSATALAVEELGGVARSGSGDTLTWKEVPQTVIFGRTMEIVDQVLAVKSAMWDSKLG